MFTVKFDAKKLNKTLGNSIAYSYGFLEGINADKITFNQMLAEHTKESLESYIDAQAKMNPESLHHVYEWNRIGDESGRLFKLTSSVTPSFIKISGMFLPSTSVSDTSNEPFTNKANVMENAIGILVEPKNSNVLVFEDEGETIFTTKSIYIESPGGDAVAGSFGRVVEDFFDSYYTNVFLRPLLAKLSKPTEYSGMFKAGSMYGRGPGLAAGKLYLRSAGLTIK